MMWFSPTLSSILAFDDDDDDDDSSDDYGDNDYHLSKYTPCII